MSKGLHSGQIPLVSLVELADSSEGLGEPASSTESLGTKFYLLVPLVPNVTGHHGKQHLTAFLLLSCLYH